MFDGDRAAECGDVRLRDVHRQMLTFRREDLLKFRDGNAGLDRDRQISGRIIHDLVERSSAQPPTRRPRGQTV